MGCGKKVFYMDVLDRIKGIGGFICLKLHGV